MTTPPGMMYGYACGMTTVLPEGGETAVKTMLLLTRGVGAVGEHATPYPQAGSTRTMKVRWRMPSSWHDRCQGQGRWTGPAPERYERVCASRSAGTVRSSKRAFGIRTNVPRLSR